MRRLAALLAALTLTASVLTGCSTLAATTVVTILHPWSGAEEEAFRRILDALDDGEPYRIEPVGTSSYRQVLELGRAQGDPVDIVVLPSLGELADYAGEDLVREVTATEHPYPWNVWERLGRQGGKRYGVAVKAQLKSITWSDGSGPGWCMGVGDASAPGWPGTDWVEDILLRDAGASTYRRWVAGRVPWSDPQVVAAWSTWLTDYVAAVPGGPTAALLTKFGEASGLPLLAPDRTCANDRRSSYVAADYAGMRLNRFDRGGGVVVSADFAALVTGTPEAEAVLAKLAGPDTQRRWLDAGSGYPLDPAVTRSTGTEGAIEGQVRDALAERGSLCFDASDLMPVAERTAFEQAVLTVLEDPRRLPDVLTRLDRTSTTPVDDRLDLPCATAN
ncbi:alpha-glucoside transport system substrate-binding protein [Actinokineospora baliensis]|uniref:hypothetical protein n=1 Tax=Actinokineospora baliensis TaxID=547056 RepID=UPI00195E5CA1|nr:hypothetical protein [Actinokineospora baliensis]MBM7774362.1 alpha-glucoside transport system substrate-binding protein [Actinokineospora baliensis]